MSDPDFSTFPLAAKGNQFEDFEEGQEFDHHWGRTFTAGDCALFATTTLAYNPMYTNAEYARGHGHPGSPVPPLLVLCTSVGLSVEDLSEGGGPFLGVNDIQFHHPVYPGQTIRARSRVVEMRESASRPNDGIVTWRTEALDENERVVLSYRRTNLVRKRRRVKDS